MPSADGKVVLITGGARGMGRSHALRFAEEGADVVVVDICRQDTATPYGLASRSDLEETAALVEARGRHALAREADVRDQAALDAAVAEAIERFGHIDVVVPNAGVVSFGKLWELTEDQWSAAINVLLTGVWHTVKATVPHMIAAGRGGSIVIIGSVAGHRASPNIGHYVTAKHGLVGLAKTLALEVAEHSIRVNVVAPGTVATEMALNDRILRNYRPDLEAPTVDDVDAFFRARNPLPVRWSEPADISNAVLWLASEQARHITGTVLTVDAGWSLR